VNACRNLTFEGAINRFDPLAQSLSGAIPANWSWMRDGEVVIPAAAEETIGGPDATGSPY